MNPIIQNLMPKNQMNNLYNMNNPEAMYNNLMQNNPQFAQFVNSNKGKTPEQIMQENNINPMLLNLFRK